MSGLVLYRWDGEAMRPANSIARSKAAAQYEVGALYPLDERRDRSERSHDHYFACVTEVWKNLSDEALLDFPTSEHLRKRALIRAGYRTERTIVFENRDDAVRVAAFLKPADEFAFVTVHGSTVVELKAKSQSFKDMDAREFQQSKDAVLQVLSEMIGVDVTTLRREAGMAA
jgi:hypothetical protein